MSSSTPNSNSSRKCRPKKVSSNSKLILTLVNPEVFDTPPRSGGFKKTSSQQMSQNLLASYVCTESISCLEFENDSQYEKSLHKKKSYVSDASTTFSKGSKLGSLDLYHTDSMGSREFRLTRAIEKTDWDITGIDETETAVDLSDPFYDCINLLAVTISCVMLMAAQEESIPEEYFIWAKNYLNCIKDEQGVHPPNVQGILNHIRYLIHKKKSSCLLCCTAKCGTKSRSVSRKRSSSSDSSFKKQQLDYSSDE